MTRFPCLTGGARRRSIFTTLGWLSFLFALLAVKIATASPSVPPSGSWDGTLSVGDVDVPFRFELALNNGKARVAFLNGEERVRSTSGSFDADALTVRFDHYASKLEAKWLNGQLAGSYARAGKPSYGFHAIPHRATADAAEKVPLIAGQWEITVSTPKGDIAWRLFIRQAGAAVSASILRVDGDTGNLEGTYRSGTFLLSHFSGARPLLLEIRVATDGSLELEENRKARYRAVRSSEARAQHLPEPADPSRWTSVKDPSEPLHFTGVTLDGVTLTQADPRFRGKVVLVNVMGSWCPNCHDEAPFLAALYRKYHKRGLEIVALSFEDSEERKDPARLRAFVKAYAIDYSVLLVGEPNELGAKLPQAVNLNTWPATFFIGRDGLVRGAHAGFASKATGAAHQKLKAEFNATVARLLAEKP
jgi:thiol-disulfide isomerase/thioredoxin